MMYTFDRRYCCRSGSAFGGVRGMKRGSEKGMSSFDICEIVKNKNENKNITNETKTKYN